MTKICGTSSTAVLIRYSCNLVQMYYFSIATRHDASVRGVSTAPSLTLQDGKLGEEHLPRQNDQGWQPDDNVLSVFTTKIYRDIALTHDSALVHTIDISSLVVPEGMIYWWHHVASGVSIDNIGAVTQALLVEKGASKIWSNSLRAWCHEQATDWTIESLSQDLPALPWDQQIWFSSYIFKKNIPETSW